MRGTVHFNGETSSTSQAAQWARAVALAEIDGGTNVKDMAAHIGATERVLKAAQAPLLTTDSDMDGLTETMSILTSFAPLLRSSSAFFRCLDSGMIRVPLRTRLTWLTGAAAMAVVNEGQAISVSRLISDNVTIDALRSSGIVILSKEFMKFLSAGGEAFLSTELRRALTASVDTAFFAAITDGSTPVNGSAGITADAAAIDLRWLFRHAELTVESRPLLVCSPDVAIAASTLMDTGFTFPDMSPTGGSMCNVPCMVSDALAEGTLGLIDAAGLAGDALGLEIKSAKHANVQLESSPDSPVSASTSFVNLWQRNLVGLMPQIYWGIERLRDNAFCKVTGIAWGSGADSPA